jgi:ribose 5-phosphate isomerase A
MNDAEKKAAKQAAARAAARLVVPNSIVGLGTGSTATFFVKALAERVQNEGLIVRAVVPTSEGSRALAERHGLTIVPLGPDTWPDLTVDGADEVQTGDLALIKGGGGALVREKLVAVASRRFVVIADADKAVERLGVFPLPVAVVPFGAEATRARIEEAVGVPAALRTRKNDPGAAPFVTDDGLYLLDLRVGGPAITDAADWEARLKRITGVVEVGLFVGVAHEALLGQADGSVRHFP